VVDRETWLVPGLCRRSSRASPTRTAGTGASDEIKPSVDRSPADKTLDA
jgi:hypothetical protein